jgi:hypothetical protein
MSYEFITSPKLTNQFLAIVHTHWQWCSFIEDKNLLLHSYIIIILQS